MMKGLFRNRKYGLSASVFVDGESSDIGGHLLYTKLHFSRQTTLKTCVLNLFGMIPMPTAVVCVVMYALGQFF